MRVSKPKPAVTASTEPWAAPDNPVLATVRRVLHAVVPPTARYRLYWRMLETPGVSELYIRGRGRLRHRRLRSSTRIVIEGFPSSGNTFSRQAFLLANPDVAPNDLNSHTHSPRVVKRAVRGGVPCIVLARDPRDAVASAVQRFEGTPVEGAFRYYEHYYRTLMPMRGQFIIVDFPDLIADFGSVIDRCNELYGVQFSGRVDSGPLNDAVRASMEERDRGRFDDRTGQVRTSRPSAARKPAADLLTRLDERERAALDRAVATWREFVGHQTAAP